MRPTITTALLLATLSLAGCGDDSGAATDMAQGTDGPAGADDLSGPTRELKFLVQPTSVRTGSAITAAVQVSVVNSNGDVLTTATDSISLSIGTNPGSAALGGTVTQAAVNGVATFADLTLDKAGTGYTLTASAAGDAMAVSMPFDDLRVLGFATPTMLATDTSVNSQVFATGHFHSTLYDDFVASQNAVDNVIVYLSNGTGGFDGGHTFTTGDQPIAVATGDIDGDGKIDIVVQCQKEVDVLLGDGAGSFGTKVPFLTGNAGSTLAGIALGKFTKSAKLDIVVADTSDNSIYLYTNASTTGTPVFTTTHTTGPASLGFAKGITTADFNGDGAADVAFGSFTATGTATVWLNANTGVASSTFAIGNASSPPMLGAGSVAQTCAAADFNGDGKADLFVPDDTPKGSGGIQNQGNVFISKATGGFNGAAETNVGDDPFSATTADFDKDGHADVAIASFGGLPFSGSSPSDLEILLGKGDGTFQLVKTFITHAADNSGRAVTVGDFNGDGLPDAVVGSNPAWVFLNTSK